MSITVQQFQQIKRRLAGTRSSPAVSVTSVAANHEIILGIDPSLRGTGYGIVRRARPIPTLLAHGTVKCPGAWQRSRCLVKIAEALRDVVKAHQPTVCVIEGLFYAQNLQTAILMGEARGVSLLAAAEAGLDIYEIAPRKVKQAIVGYGAAQKQAVAKMVQRLLNLSAPPEPDAADALALALTHLQEQNRYALTQPKKI